MATVVKRPGGKWQTQVRHDGRACILSFTKRADAVQSERETEQQAERGVLQDTTALAELRTTTLVGILTRYRDTVVSQKEAGRNEACMLNGIIEHDRKLASLMLDKLKPADFADWRNQRAKEMKPASISRYMGLMQHALYIARQDWQLPLRSKPVREVRRPTIRIRRERRVRDNERAVRMEAAKAYRR